jgi:hypothetical protein
MRTIKTLEDIRLLKQAQVLHPEYLDFVGEYFGQLMEALRDEDVPEEKFNLDDSGYIVILEKGDNLRDLSSVGLNREDGGLLSSMFEYIEEYSLEGVTVYKVAVLYTNNYMMTFFLEKGIWDEEAEAFLRDNADKAEEQAPGRETAAGACFFFPEEASPTAGILSAATKLTQGGDTE